MLDLFPYLFTTLIADASFSAFQDANTLYKIFKKNNSQTEETPFITIDFLPSGKHITGYANITAVFSVWGNDTEWEAMYALQSEIDRVFRDASCMTYNGNTLQYSLLGDAVTSEGENPVTENVNVSLALNFGVIS